jgi:DNA-binding transcriptional ArsR family regulator
MLTQPDIFTAIADPTRRAILHLLAAQPLPVTAVAEHFPVSRPAISKHLRVLRQVGLVDEQKIGRQRYYKVQPEPLHEIQEWIAYFDTFWQTKLASLKTHLEEQAK